MTGVSLDAVPMSGASRTEIPREFRSVVNSVAAANAGLTGFSGDPETEPSLIIKDPSGPASTLRIPSPQLGA